MKLGSVESKVLLVLAESAKGLHVYTIYKRLKIPLGDVIRSVLRLQTVGLLSLTEDEHAKLTDEGKVRSQKIASSVSTKSSKPWREVPDRFKKHHDESDLDFFIPKITLLDKNFFC